MSKELFQLIKSLTQSEKRYFKLHVGKHVNLEKSIAIKIFDTLVGQKEYNNKQLLEKISLKKGKHLRMYKSMLQNMVIRELSSYHSDITAQSQLRRLIDRCDVLFYKGQYTLCKKALLKAKDLANKYETFMYLIEIINYENRIGVALGEYNSAFILDSYNEQQVILKKQNNLIDYARVSEELHSFIRKNQISRTLSDRGAIKKILRNKLLSSENEALSPLAKVLYFFCKSAASFAEGNWGKANYYLQKQLEIQNNAPHLIELRPEGYISNLQNLLATYLELKQYTVFEKQASAAKDILSSLPEKLKSRLKSHLLNLENLILKMYIDTGQFEKGLAIEKETEEDLGFGEESKVSAGLLIPFLFNIAYLNFGLLNYKKALHYTNQLLSIKGTEVRMDIQLFARLINIIIYFEIGDMEIIPYLTKSLYRQLIQKEKLYKVEELIANWIRIKLPKIKNNNALISSFRELKVNLELIASDPEEANALRYFDFISWLESKIENKTFAEIVRNKARQVTLDQGRE